ncbi:MAG: hypothetical protein JXA15_04475 [Spirochaetales bacterium]|nr:hypothetical protein [Spirochaetales bacterium]
MSHAKRTPIRAVAASIAIAALSSCASSVRPERDAPLDAMAIAAEALSLALGGEVRTAVDALVVELDQARLDVGERAALLETKAWALLLGGDLGEAREAFEQSRIPGQATLAASRVLEFRLTALADRALARRYAESLGDSSPDADLEATAFSLMAGDADLRDDPPDDLAEASRLASYLSGYRVEPVPGAGAPAAEFSPESAAVEAPVVVVAELESVGADPATAATARLSYRDGLVKSGAFRVVDAASRKAALEELELELSGATASEHDRAVGSLYSADYVASGSLVATENGWLVAWTLASAQDGGIVAAEFAAAPDHAAISASAHRFCVALGEMSRRGEIPATGSPK